MHRSKSRTRRIFGSGTPLLLAAAFAKVMLLHSGAALAAGDENHVRDLAARSLESTAGPGTELVLHGTRAPAFSVRVELAGKRIVVDVANADLAGVAEPITSPVGLVGGALTQTFKTNAGTMTRLTVNLLKPASYRVFADGNDLRVQLAPAAQTAPGAPSLFPAPAAVQAVAAPELADVRFERRKLGTGQTDRVIIQASEVPSYQLSAGHDGRLRLTMKNVRVPANLARALELGAFGGPVRKVSTSFDTQTNSAVIELERAGDDQGVLSVEGKQIVWSFEAARAVVSAKPRDTSKTVTVARERPVDEGPRVETSIRPIVGVGVGAGAVDGVDAEVSGGGAAGFTSTVNAQVGRYSGRRIDLDLKDADIHNILRLLADVGRVNIVTADDVTGSVTIRMRNVPWDQALDVVLQAKGLGMVRSGNLIRVAPLAALQKERELRLAAAKQEYELTPLETRLIPVSYARADEIQARAKDLLSPRGSIAVDERTNVLIARDISGGLDNIEQLVRALDTQTPQVLIEARIVEATSRYQRDIGIQWGGDATFSEATGNPTGIAFPSSVGLAGGNYDGQSPTQGLSPTQGVVNAPNYAVNLPAAVGTGQGGALGISLGSINNAFNLGVRLSAAEASGLLRIVSSPRILTLDNREARINQGTLIPFAQLSAQGVQTTFQEAKLQLLVRPHVTADGSVSMHVKINRDEPDFNQTSARGDPTILKREAETDLLVMDGHTAVIGGIYTRNTGRNLDQVPFFGDIPILGVLFQRRRASDTRNELVIFLTPRIVNRAEALGR